jgi:hypothetical protein
MPALRSGYPDLSEDSVVWLSEMAALLLPLMRRQPKWEEQVNEFLLTGMHLVDEGTATQRDKLTERLASYLDGVIAEAVPLFERYDGFPSDGGAMAVAEIVKRCFFDEIFDRLDRVPDDVSPATRN